MTPTPESIRAEALEEAAQLCDQQAAPSDAEIDELSRYHGLHSAPWPAKSMVRDFARALLSRFAAPAVAPDRQRLRALVDLTWKTATDSGEVPEAQWADSMIDRVFGAPTPPAVTQADDEMVALGGTAPPVPRWLLDAAQRIERYMAANAAVESWAIGGIQKRTTAPGAPSQEGMGEPVALPSWLLDLIGEYGSARQNSRSDPHCLHCWERLIAGIKRYAAPVAQPAADAGMERALTELVDKIVPGLDTGDLVADAATASRALNRVQPAATAEPDDGAQEGAEIIENMIRNIEADGMYSKESTLGFLAQALYCLRPANAAPVAVQAQRLLFPTMLRKMWSGGEVQAWLDEQLGIDAPKPSAKGSLERYRKWLADQAQAQQTSNVPAAQPIETIQYWADAYANPASGDHFMGHGMVVTLLREYAALRTSLVAQAQQDAELLDALAQAEAGLVFAGAEQMTPTGDFVPTPLLALRIVREELAGQAPSQAVLAGLAEAEDAARYRWLRDRNDWHAEPRINAEDGTKWSLTFYTPAPILDPTDDDNLDNALIAAMLEDAAGNRARAAGGEHG